MLLLILPLRRMKTLLRRLVPVVEGVSVHNTHDVNTVCPSLTETADKKIYILL